MTFTRPLRGPRQTRKLVENSGFGISDGGESDDAVNDDGFDTSRSDGVEPDRFKVLMLIASMVCDAADRSVQRPADC